MTAAGSFRTLKWADPLLYVLTDPRGLSRYITGREDRAFWPGFIIPVMAAFADIVTISVLGREGRFFYYKVSYGWILLVLLSGAKIAIFGSLMDLFGQFRGQAGRMKETISILNYSLFPKLFLLPLVFIFKTVNFAPVFFLFLFSLALMVWSAVAAIQGISEMHGISFGRGAVIYLFPYVFAGILVFFTTVLAFMCGLGLFFA